MDESLKKVAPEKASGKAVFAAIGLLSAIAVLFLWWLRPNFLSAVDLKASDAMFMLRGTRSAPAEVVIVAIDERSVNELGRWPWSRTTTASLVEALSEAKTVALDIVFSEEQDAKADSKLSDAIISSRNVVLGYFFRGDSGVLPGPDALAALDPSKIKLLTLEAGAEHIPWPVFGSIETNTKIIAKGAAGFGAFNTMPREDGLYREAHLLFGYGAEAYPALPLEALRHYLGGEHVVRLAPYGVDSLLVGERAVPVDEFGALQMNFYGPSGSFPTYSAVDVISGRVDPQEFKGRLVFVGVTEKAVYDIRPTPLDALMPGVELHATAAGNMLKGDFMIRDGRVISFDVIMTIISPLALAFFLFRVRRTLSGLLIFILLLAAVIAGEAALFSFWDLKTAVIYPALSLIFCSMAGEAYRNLVVEKRNRYLRRAFSSYVSPELVSEILDDPGALKLGGEKREVTVLFSDIRGFTGISESLPPEELVEFLNRYLSPMTGIVLEEKGMVDKYIGDAIMAVFNAPVEVEDHAARACSAALRMMEALSSFNSRWEGSGYPAIEIGIGINTGEAVVGNMGAELKLNYTAIGDTVNLGSRLEGMNKIFGTAIIASSATRLAAGKGFFFRELDLVRVRGRNEPITIHELGGRVGENVEKSNVFSRFQEALGLYRKRSFDKALELFMELQGLGDGPSAIYAERCRRLIAAPPPDDWDGVSAAAMK